MRMKNLIRVGIVVFVFGITAWSCTVVKSPHVVTDGTGLSNTPALTTTVGATPPIAPPGARGTPLLGTLATSFLMPTVPPEQAEQEILRLLTDNGGCRLPCWWGILPGEARWDDTRAFLEPYSMKIASSGFAGSSQDRIHTVYARVPLDLGTRGFWTTVILERDGVVFLVRASPYNLQLFSLPAVLRDYGLPSTIMITTYRQPREGYLPLRLAVFNADTGFMAWFESRAELNSGVIRGCFRDLLPDLILWPPSADLTPELIAQMNIGHLTEEVLSNYRDLGNATGTTIEQLVSSSESLSSDLCIDTPADLWPPPG